MSGLSTLEKMFTISDVVEESPFQNLERADCAVRAVVAVTGREYRTVHDHFCRGGRHPGRRSPNGLAEKVIRQLNHTLEPWEVKGKTIRTVERELPAKGSFLISVRGHLLAVVDGETRDWASDRLKHVLEVWRVAPI